MIALSIKYRTFTKPATPESKPNTDILHFVFFIHTSQLTENNQIEKETNVIIIFYNLFNVGMHFFLSCLD